MPENDKASFEDILARDGRLCYTNVGDSMLPLIRQGRDILVIAPVNGRLKKYDVPLYRRDSGQYVLHRVIKVRDHDYVTCGDNRWRTESGITDRHVLGVLVSLIRNGREISLTDPVYRLYVFAWCTLFPVRAIILRGLKYIKRILIR